MYNKQYLNYFYAQMVLLTHTDLRNIGHALGYRDFEAGICQGYSCMVLQAILADELEVFYDRLHFMKSYMGKINDLLYDTNQAKNTIIQHLPITPRQEMALSVLAFYDGIALYQNPELYTHVFHDKKHFQIYLESIYKCANSKKLAQKQLYTLHNKPYILNIKQLITFLNQLSNTLKKLPFATPILIRSIGHTVCLRYHNGWEYFDINNMHNYPDSPNYCQQLTTEQLANSIFQSFDKDTTKQVSCSMIILSNIDSPQLRLKLFKLYDKYSNVIKNIIEKNSLMSESLWILFYHFHQSLLKKLIHKKTLDLNQVIDTQNNNYAIHIASELDQVQIIRFLLKTNSLLLNSVNLNKDTPLMLASKNNNICALNELLQHYPSTSEKNDDGNDALMLACRNNHLDIVKKLLEYGASPNQLNNNNESALSIACDNGNIDIVKELFKYKLTIINQTTNNNQTPLYKTCQIGHEEIVSLLLENGAHHQLFTKSDSGLNPLEIACRNGNVKVAELILNNNRYKKIDIYNQHRTEALFVACESLETKEIRELFQLLLKYGASIHQLDKNKVRPLDIAFRVQNTAAISVLLDTMVNMKFLPSQVMSAETLSKAYHWAQSNNRLEIVKYLTDNNDVDKKEAYLHASQPSLIFNTKKLTIKSEDWRD